MAGCTRCVLPFPYSKEPACCLVGVTITDVFSKEWAQLISKMSESFKAVEKVADSDIMLHIRKIFLSRFIWITMWGQRSCHSLKKLLVRFPVCWTRFLLV